MAIYGAEIFTGIPDAQRESSPCLASADASQQRAVARDIKVRQSPLVKSICQNHAVFGPVNWHPIASKLIAGQKYSQPNEEILYAK